VELMVILWGRNSRCDVVSRPPSSQPPARYAEDSKIISHLLIAYIYGEDAGKFLEFTYFKA
jgi:hypothetical protein